MKKQTETVKKRQKTKAVAVVKKKKKKAGGRTSTGTCAKSKAKRKKILLEALKESLGIVSRACKKAKIPRSEFYKWYHADEKFRDAVEDVNEIALDFVEERHYALIQALNAASIIFHLKTKGSGRGYSERMKLEHGGELSLKVSEMTNEQLAAIICGKEINFKNEEKKK